MRLARCSSRCWQRLRWKPALRRSTTATARWWWTEMCIRDRAGLDVKSLQYLMGHSNASVTLDVYTHSSFESDVYKRQIQNCITILQNDHVLADAIRLNLLSERIDICLLYTSRCV